jgi:hypothetical protein
MDPKSCARSNGALIEKNTLPLAMKMPETKPAETMSLPPSGNLTERNAFKTSAWDMSGMLLHSGAARLAGA